MQQQQQPPPPPHKADELLFFVIWIRVASFADELTLIRLAGTAHIMGEITSADAVWKYRLDKRRAEGSKANNIVTGNNTRNSKEDKDDERAKRFIHTVVEELLHHTQERGIVPRFRFSHPCFIELLARPFLAGHRRLLQSLQEQCEVHPLVEKIFFPSHKHHHQSVVNNANVVNNNSHGDDDGDSGHNQEQRSATERDGDEDNGSRSPSRIFTVPLYHPLIWAGGSDDSNANLTGWPQTLLDAYETDPSKRIRNRVTRAISDQANDRLALVGTIREVRYHLVRAFKFMAISAGVSLVIYGAASVLSAGVASTIDFTEGSSTSIIVATNTTDNKSNTSLVASALAAAASGVSSSDDATTTPIMLRQVVQEIAQQQPSIASSSSSSSSSSTSWFFLSRDFFRKFFACVRDGWAVFPVPPRVTIVEKMGSTFANVLLGAILLVVTMMELTSVAKYGVCSLQELHNRASRGSFVRAAYYKRLSSLTRMLAFQLPVYFAHTAMHYLTVHFAARASSIIAIPLFLSLRMCNRFLWFVLRYKSWSDLSPTAALEEGWYGETLELPSFVVRAFLSLGIQSRWFDIDNLGGRPGGVSGDAFYARVVLAAATEAFWGPSVDKATLGGVAATAASLAKACLWNTALYAARHGIVVLANKFRWFR